MAKKKTTVAAAPAAVEAKETETPVVPETLLEEQVEETVASVEQEVETEEQVAEVPEQIELKAPITVSTPEPKPAPKVAETPAAEPPKSRECIELCKMLDMYRDMCSVRTMDRDKLKERMRVLYSIVRLVAPNSTPGSQRYSTRELVETLFKRMVEGSGTIFSDGYIFKLTYTLPASDAVKFEAFYTAFLQLVNARLRGSKITFSMDALRDVLKNEGVMEAIRIIRARFE